MDSWVAGSAPEQSWYLGHGGPSAPGVKDENEDEIQEEGEEEEEEEENKKKKKKKKKKMMMVVVVGKVLQFYIYKLPINRPCGRYVTYTKCTVL